MSDEQILFDKDVKKEIFFGLTKNDEVHFKEIQTLKTNLYLFGQNVSVPNSNVILCNKFNELTRIFNQRDVSIISDENNGKYEASFVGSAILEDLKKMQYDALKKFSELDYIYILIHKKIIKFKKCDFLLLKLRKMFDSKFDFKIYCNNELKELIRIIEEYTVIVDNIWKYNLEDNLTSSVFKKIINLNLEKDSLDEIYDRKIVPVFKKLGMEDKLSELNMFLTDYYLKKSNLDNKKLLFENSNVE